MRARARSGYERTRRQGGEEGQLLGGSARRSLPQRDRPFFFEWVGGVPFLCSVGTQLGGMARCLHNSHAFFILWGPSYLESDSARLFQVQRQHAHNYKHSLSRTLLRCLLASFERTKGASEEEEACRRQQHAQRPTACRQGRLDRLKQLVISRVGTGSSSRHSTMLPALD
jgi:hypothetical protein